MHRRDFLRTTVAAMAASRLALAHPEETQTKKEPGMLPKRLYKDDVELSVLALGGVVVGKETQDEANRRVAVAIEHGINYFDVAPIYFDGEEKLGPALEPYRKNVFLACKSTDRTREGCEFEFNRSLERLHTDYFDLYQLHSISDVAKDVDAVFQTGGVMDMLIEKKKAGQIRYLGFSAHSEEAALAAMDRYDFDSLLFPLNFAAVDKGHFGMRILEAAQRKGVARIALKAMARQKWQEGDTRTETFHKSWYEPLVDPETISLALRWTLSHPITAAIPPGDWNLFTMAMEVASNLAPLTDAETKQLMAKAANLDPVFQAA